MLKTKILAALLCFCIAASLLPVTARAESSEQWRTVHVDSYETLRQWLKDDETCTLILDTDIERHIAQSERKEQSR